jgi:hypothetical protein
MKVSIKKMDAQGRIVLPFSWRRGQMTSWWSWSGTGRLRSFHGMWISLSNCVDEVEVDVDQFDDYHRLRKALR